MNQQDRLHLKAVGLIDTAIKTLANSKPEMHLVHSSAAHTAVSVSHELKAINGTEYLHYCERIRTIDARFMGITEQRVTA